MLSLQALWFRLLAESRIKDVLQLPIAQSFLPFQAQGILVQGNFQVLRGDQWSCMPPRYCRWRRGVRLLFDFLSGKNLTFILIVFKLSSISRIHPGKNFWLHICPTFIIVWNIAFFITLQLPEPGWTRPCGPPRTTKADQLRRDLYAGVYGRPGIWLWIGKNVAVIGYAPEDLIVLLLNFIAF